MANIKQIGSDLEKVGKKLAKNPYALAGIGIGAVGIVVLLWNSGEKSDEELTNATGYDGLGTAEQDNMYDGLSEFQDLYTQDMSSLIDYINSTVSDMNGKIDNTNTGGSSSGTISTNTGSTTVDTSVSNRDWLNKERIQPTSVTATGSPVLSTTLQQMYDNSLIWGYTTSDSERKALENKNKQLGNSIGAYYDSKTGTWWENSSMSQRLFTQEKDELYNHSASGSSYDENIDYMGSMISAINSNAGASAINKINDIRTTKMTDKGVSNTQVGYNKNVDYSALYNKAKAQGANTSVLGAIDAQRQAKIKGENLNADGSPKTNNITGVSSSGTSGLIGSTSNTLPSGSSGSSSSGGSKSSSSGYSTKTTSSSSGSSSKTTNGTPKASSGAVDHIKNVYGGGSSSSSSSSKSSKPKYKPSGVRY